MPYRVELRPAARREFVRLPGEVQDRIRPRIDALADAPRPPGCEKLAGHASRYRVRVGDYRVLYEVADRTLVVTVTRVAHRREAYRR